MSHVKQATPEGAAGSAADNKDAKGVWKGGTWRAHFVSFPMTVGFGAKANIQATKLK